MPFASRVALTRTQPTTLADTSGRHTNSTQRLRSLDGLRGIAAVGIMIFHFNIFFVPQAQLTALFPPLARAYLAVDLFFILSGFVMAHVYGAALAQHPGQTWRPFAVARFGRIYPLFALTTLITAAVVALPGAKPAFFVSFSREALTLQPFLLQQWASSLTWNYPAWSVSTEMEAYALFVFLAAPLLRGRHPLMIATACLAMVAGLSVAGGGRLNSFSGLPALLRTIAEFCLGVLLYRAYRNSDDFLNFWSGVLAVAALGAGLVLRLDVVTVAGFALMTYFATTSNGMTALVLDSRPAVALGNWSYSIYLLHAPVHLAVMGAFAAIGHPVSQLTTLNARTLLVATTLLVVVLSAATHRYFEKPSRRIVAGLIEA